MKPIPIGKVWKPIVVKGKLAFRSATSTKSNDPKAVAQRQRFAAARAKCGGKTGSELGVCMRENM